MTDRGLSRRLRARAAGGVAALALPLAVLMAGCGGESGRPLGRPADETVALRQAANEICRDVGDPLAALDDAETTGQRWRIGTDALERERTGPLALAALDAPAGMSERYAAFVDARRERVLLARTVVDTFAPRADGSVLNFAQIFADPDPEYARLADELGIDDCAG